MVLNDQGCVEYLIVSSQDRFIPIPWTAATVNFEQRIIRVNIPVARFREVPTFTQQNWPNFSDPGYTQNVYRFYNVRPRQERMIEHRENRTGPPERQPLPERRVPPREERRERRTPPNP